MNIGKIKRTLKEYFDKERKLKTADERLINGILFKHKDAKDQVKLIIDATPRNKKEKDTPNTMEEEVKKMTEKKRKQSNFAKKGLLGKLTGYLDE